MSTNISKRRFLEISRNFNKKNIAVIGDLMLDIYVWGTASRISQEAPVPVVKIEKQTYSPGGAANVMKNIMDLGGNVTAFGVTGCDENGENLRRLLTDCGIDVSMIISDKERRTTTKKRVIANSQQLLRIDYEDIEPVNRSLSEESANKLIKLIRDKRIDAIIFEDYAKGMLTGGIVTHIMEELKDIEIITALDPHPGHLITARGFSVVTPNRKEAFNLAGVYCSPPLLPVEDDTALKEVAEKLQHIWDPDKLLITLGAHGMALFDKNMDEPIVIPTKAREVFDVSGAGDTVIGAFTLSLCAGALPTEAAHIANHAAGIVVGKIGTVSVTKEELEKTFK